MQRNHVVAVATVVGVLAIVIAGALAWIGRESTLLWLAEKVQARSDGALHLDNVHGSLLHTIHADRIQWHGKTAAVDAQNATIRWAPWWLLTGRIAFHQADADTLAITRTAAAEGKPAGLPEHLHTPVRLRFDSTHVQTLQYTPPGGEPQVYRDIVVGADLGGRAWTFKVERLQTRWGRLKGDATVGTDAPHKLVGSVDLSPEGHAATAPPVAVHAKADGTVEDVGVAVEFNAQESRAKGTFRIAPRAPVLVRSMDVAFQHFNPHHLGGAFPNGSIDGTLKADTAQDGALRGAYTFTNSVRGLLDQGKLPLASVRGDLVANAERWSFDDIAVDFGEAGTLAGSGWVGARDGGLKVVTDALDLSKIDGKLWPTRLAATIASEGPRDAQHVTVDARDGRVAFTADGTAEPHRITVAHARAAAKGGGSAQVSGTFDFNAAKSFRTRLVLAKLNPSAFGKYPVAVVNGRLDARGALAPVLQLHAEGSITSSTLRGLPVTARGNFVTGGKNDPTIALNVTGTVGATNVAAKGTIVDPRNIEALDLDLVLSGRTLAELYTATRIPFPETPPYRLSGVLALHDDTWTLKRFKGQVGQSDLAGDFMVDLRKERPFMRATLDSNRLDVRDLGGFIGAGDPHARPDRVLPDSQYKLDKLNAAEVDVTFTGRRIANPRLPLNAMTAHLVIDHGQVTLQPLDFRAAGGQIDARIVMDARRAPIRTDADFQARGLALNRLAPGIKAVMESAGRVDGRTRLVMRGNSIAEMLGSADGNLVLAMRGGAMSDLVLRAANLDIAHVVPILARGDKPIALRCFVADFRAQDGMLRPRNFVIDSEHTVVRGDGDVNLRNETLGLKLVATPKDGSLIALRGPIRIDGTMAQPAVHPELGGVLARVGAAVALGAVAGPAALIPLIETGKEQQVDCEPLMLDASRFIRTGTPPAVLEANSSTPGDRAAASAAPRGASAGADHSRAAARAKPNANARKAAAAAATADGAAANERSPAVRPNAEAALTP